ncbi:MAG: hypothetical protein AAB726_01035 [Patescibacteria group bacterium]|mgnify:CR=1 FL=1
MNKELIFDSKKFISAKRVEEKYGYNADYIGQLCRGGEIEARMVGRSWFVSEEAILRHLGGTERGPRFNALRSVTSVPTTIGSVLPAALPTVNFGAKFLTASFFMFVAFFFVFATIKFLEVKHPESLAFLDNVSTRMSSALSLFSDLKSAIIVVPSALDEAKDNRVKRYIKNSFSDEVEIIPDETSVSGIIRPVFKSKNNIQDYLYVMVPIKD